MKKLLVVGVIVLFIAVAVAPALNALDIEENEINETKEQKETLSLQDLPQLQISKSNRINSIKLNPPQPAEWPPHSKCVGVGFGRISNTKHEFNGDVYYYSFNCENVICSNYGDNWRTWHHYNNGEVLYLYGAYIGIITDHFLFILLS